MIDNSIYINFILKNIPKVITQVDRDEDSPTYGSCDRNFWHLKIRDFSSAILQQTSLTMALLYKLNFKGNIYYNNKKVYEWSKASLDFWKNIQLRDGSYNEYYPYEHGFPPTAFTLFSSAETYKLLELNDKSIIDSMRKTAKFLIRNIEKKAFNQEMASIAGLYSYYTITKEKWVIDGLNKKLERVLKLQKQEGWFPEYGGADFGYLSVAFDMLSEYYWQSKDARVVEPLNKIIDFIKYFVHPDGTIGGEYGSRNTIYFLPNGLEVMNNIGNKEASAIKMKIYEEIDSDAYFQNSIDDRYFSHYVIHSFLRALDKEKDKSSNEHIKLPYELRENKYFKQSGLMVISEDSYYAVISLRKGGIVKLFSDCEERFIDFGYRINEGNTSVAATNWLDQEYKISLTNTNEVKVKGRFNLIKVQTSSPIKHFILRIISLLFGKSIIGLLKKKLIFINKHKDVYFERKLELKPNELVIEDLITSPKSTINLKSANTLSLRHVASGKFFKTTELIDKKGINLKDVRKVRIRQLYDVNLGKAALDYEELE